MEKTWFVYKHTSPSNKVYIGITSQKPIYRWRNGLGYNTQPYFWRAIQKYGWENFLHEILFEGLSEDDAKEKEIELISFYQSWHPNFGYNVSLGGSGSYGYHLTEEMKRQIGERSRRLWTDEIYRKRIIESMTGRPVSEDTKAKLSKRMADFYSSEKGDVLRKEQSDRQRQVWENENYRIRQSTLASEAMSRVWNNPEYRARQSASHIGRYAGEKHPMYGKKHTEDAKRKIGEKSKEMWDDPEFRETHRMIMSALFTGEGNPFFGKTHTENTKKRISESRKGKCVGEANPQYGKPISEEAKAKMRKKKNKPVAQIDLNTGEVIQIWESIKTAKDTLHIGHISEVCGSNSKYKTAGGYGWRYMDKE